MTPLRLGMMLLVTVSLCSAKQPTLASDEEARSLVAKRAMQMPYKPVCADTHRMELLEDDLFELLPEKIVDGQLNHPMYFYGVTGIRCYGIVTQKDGTKQVESKGSVDDFSAPYAGVDRRTKHIYWFEGDTAAAEFVRLFRDLKVQVTDDLQANSVVHLHRYLVRSRKLADIRDVPWEMELKHHAEVNFKSAWSSYNRNRDWEHKFQDWWTKFRKDVPTLSYSVESEQVADGFLVRGVGYRGYEFEVPRGNEPAEGTPAVVRWKLLVHRDGRVEEQRPDVLFEYAP